MTGSQVKGNPTEKLLRAFTTDIDKTVASADFNKQFAKLYNKTALTVTCVPLSPPPYRGLLPHCHVRVPVPSTLLWTSPAWAWPWLWRGPATLCMATGAVARPELGFLTVGWRSRSA